MQWRQVGDTEQHSRGALETRDSLRVAPGRSLDLDLHLPLSPSKRPWWRITAKVREEERGTWGGARQEGEALLWAALSLFYMALLNHASLAERQEWTVLTKASTNTFAQKTMIWFIIILWSHSSETESSP